MVDYPLVFPVNGENHYSDTFWASRSGGYHHAQDIMADKMTPVVAPADGVVHYVNWSSRPDDLNPERCCSMTIDHDDGWSTWYIHLNNDTPGTDDGQGWGIADGIRPGTRVTAGQLIGWVGDSGNAENTSPHVQFELRDPEGIIVNPYQALRAARTTGTSGACRITRPAHAGDLLAMEGQLRRGDHGVEVRQLQGFLASFGYAVGDVDGTFGRRTQAALIGYQRDSGLSADGIVGPATRASIRSLLVVARIRQPLASDARLLQRGNEGRDVRRFKRLIVAAGFDPGPINRRFTLATSRAVRRFQRSSSIAIDGIVGPQTRATLAETLGLTLVRDCE